MLTHSTLDPSLNVELRDILDNYRLSLGVSQGQLHRVDLDQVTLVDPEVERLLRGNIVKVKLEFQLITFLDCQIYISTLTIANVIHFT